jgi:hypothetical protein
MAFRLDDFVRTLERMGFLNVALPFLLFFTIIFASLQKTKILGNEQDPTGKRFNIIVSLVIGLLAVIPHVLYGQGNNDGRMIIGGRSFADPVEIINNALPTVALWVIAILMFMLIFGMFGADMQILELPLSGWFAGFALIVVSYIFGSAAGWWSDPRTTYWMRSLGLNNPNNLFGVLFLLSFAVIFWFVVREPGVPATPDPNAPSHRRAWDNWVNTRPPPPSPP